MTKKIVEILADGFEEVEALAPCDFWKRCGCTVVLAALNGKSAVGAHNITVACDVCIDDIDITEYDVIFLPGGMPGSLNLYNSDKVISMLRTMSDMGRITAAICAAPMVLNKAGLLAGKRCTMYPSAALRQEYCPGIVFEEVPAVADGNVITGRGPGAAFALAFKTAVAAGFEEKAVQTAKDMLIAEGAL